MRALVFIFCFISMISFSQEIELFPNDPTTDNKFGTSMAVEGDYLMVGAPGDATFGNEAGAVYIFKKNAGNIYQQEQKIFAEDAEVGDLFGYSISMSGNFLLVGAYRNTTATDRLGAVYVFENLGGTWSQTQRLTSNSFNQGFGYSVSIRDNHLVVGAPFTGINQGAAFFYKYNGVDWEENGFFEHPQIQDSSSPELGRTVVMVNNYIYASSPFGQSRVFQKQNDTWIEESEFDNFSQFTFLPYTGDISEDGSVIAQLHNNISYFRAWDRDTNGDWNTLPNDDYFPPVLYDWGLNGVHSQNQLKIYDNEILVGVRFDNNEDQVHFGGVIYKFLKDSNGDWIYDSKITPTTNYVEFKRFGRSIHQENDILYVGAPGNSETVDSGSIYIYGLILANEDFAENNVTLYPNPGTDNITVDAKGQEIERITMYSMQGSIVFEIPVDNETSTPNIATLAPGIYLIEITSEEKSTTLKFVKE